MTVGRDALRFTPRGLRREKAAEYLGISPSKFDELGDDGRIPQPKMIDGCRVWDTRRLDEAFEAFPDKPEAAHKDKWAGVRV